MSSPDKTPPEPKTVVQAVIKYETREDPEHELYKMEKALRQAVEEADTTEEAETYDDILALMHDNIELVEGDE